MNTVTIASAEKSVLAGRIEITLTAHSGPMPKNALLFLPSGGKLDVAWLKNTAKEFLLMPSNMATARIALAELKECAAKQQPVEVRGAGLSEAASTPALAADGNYFNSQRPG